MNYEDLREIARKQPFKPFRLIVSTGEAFNVWRQDGFFLSRRYIVVGITNEDGGTDYDRSTLVNLIHIVRVEFLELPVAPGNGQAS
jgi:hypothetical protein